MRLTYPNGDELAMGIRLASKSAPNTDVYYVTSRSRPGKEHTVIHIHTQHVNRWICSCEHFYHRELVKSVVHPKLVRHCGHIKEVKMLLEMGHKVA